MWEIETSIVSDKGLIIFIMMDFSVSGSTVNVHKFSGMARIDKYIII